MSLPAYRLITPQANRSYVFKWEQFDLSTRWHYHPELELIYFIKGQTDAVIGDGFQHFEEGDLVILGPSFPHVLQENPEYVKTRPDESPFGLILQFTEEFLGPEFILKPELSPIRNLFRKARRGVLFSKTVVEKVSGILLSMHEMAESRKLIALLDVLIILGESYEYEYMTPEDYVYDHSQDEERMCAINQYVYKNFKERISIADIAAVANMTETSFCRYFKTRTLKSFTRYVNEIRIAYASRLLNHPRYSVTDVCFESGFNNLSFFTRQFKTIMKQSPQQYQKWKRAAVK